MKYFWSILLFTLALQLTAQNTVKMTAVKAENYGVAYTLPITEIKISVRSSKKVRKAGEFYEYAGRYLSVNNPIIKDEIIYSLDDVDVQTYGVPNKEQSYLVEFKTNSIAPFVTLTRDGMICAINADANLDVTAKNTQSEHDILVVTNPKKYLTEEILRAGSTAKQAEMIAKQIYTLRETRNAILTGEADNMPPDGNAYKIVMDQLDLQEKALTSMFIGTEVIYAVPEQEFVLLPTDKNIDRQVIFRFSSKMGIVEADNLAGAAVSLSMTSKESRKEVFLTDKEQKALDKKFSSGIIYNIPAKADLKVEYNNNILYNKVCDVVQYGTQDVLTTKELQYTKDKPVKIIFYPDLGAIKEIIRE